MCGGFVESVRLSLREMSKANDEAIHNPAYKKLPTSSLRDSAMESLVVWLFTHCLTLCV
ncbi:hypothetical protein [Helicobacter rodentium]|uniref:hypothetical protein n=1 Tax=Helicobacter rodentium TaxID=59617 RepID=UPI002357ADAC|nr:hypothetical protein [Helicobacter rodentium]